MDVSRFAAETSAARFAAGRLSRSRGAIEASLEGGWAQQRCKTSALFVVELRSRVNNLLYVGLEPLSLQLATQLRDVGSWIGFLDVRDAGSRVCPRHKNLRERLLGVQPEGLN
jgi:hypothetical protein